MFGEGIGGEVRFVSSMNDAKHELIARGALLVTVARAERGRLRDRIDDAIEGELVKRGAAPSVGAEDSLADQTFRARQLGYEGLAVALDCLAQAAAPVGALDGADATALAELARAASERPIALLMRREDAALPAYTACEPLERVLAPEDEWEEPVFEEEPTFSEVVEESVLEEDAESIADSVSHAVSEALASVPVTVPAPAEPSPPPPRVLVDESVWRAWLRGLREARGPQTLAQFEKTFAESYMPLASAVSAGLDAPEASAEVGEFRRSFARSYESALPMFPLTSKRPKMVFDAHEVAARVARQHGARATHMLMVASMRWDIGAKVRAALAADLAGRGSIVFEGALFAALPTTTWRQLEGIARGLESLRSPAEPQSDDPVRGRTSEIVRRVRVGARDVFKLDWVDAAVRAAGPEIADAIPAIGAECAELVLKHALALPPRTLLFVFGDHGFTQSARGEAQCGGASPEEVIAPAFAVLVGELH